MRKSQSKPLIKLGVFPLGTNRVALFADPNNASASFSAPDDDQIGDTKMVIGIKASRWEKVLTGLLHEAGELTALELRLRYAPDVDFGEGCDQYLFVMTHPQFSEMTARVAWFASKVIPRLSQLYRKHRIKK